MSARIILMFVPDIRNDTELFDVARQFFGDSVPVILLNGGNGCFTVGYNGTDYKKAYTSSEYLLIPEDKRDKRIAKIALYDVLSEITGKTMQWGALTGVRPTKLFYEALRAGDMRFASDIMKRVYRVSDKRVDILSEIIDSQRGKVFFPSDYINLYIHIPYCSTRCSYCSFVSELIGKKPEQVKSYIALLCDEIKASLEFIRSRGKKLLSVYIGGGTPTSLGPEMLELLFGAIGDVGCEYTCEAGRPDTLTEEKADIMKRYGVTRVCVNPQTLNEKTLRYIGRNHSLLEFYNTYSIIKSRNFDINCDLIAGLYGENTQDFINSYEGVRKLGPDNITVHTLSKKNGAAMRYDAYENECAPQMIEYALDNRGAYKAYYLYRQKRQVGNLENVGFSISGKECINNITTMEETVSVLACGAGAISKAVYNGGISRFANLRDVGLYIAQYEERLASKLEFFDNIFKKA